MRTLSGRCAWDVGGIQGPHRANAGAEKEKTCCCYESSHPVRVMSNNGVVSKLMPSCGQYRAMETIASHSEKSEQGKVIGVGVQFFEKININIFRNK